MQNIVQLLSVVAISFMPGRAVVPRLYVILYFLFFYLLFDKVFCVFCRVWLLVNQMSGHPFLGATAMMTTNMLKEVIHGKYAYSFVLVYYKLIAFFVEKCESNQVNSKLDLNGLIWDAYMGTKSG